MAVRSLLTHLPEPVVVSLGQIAQIDSEPEDLRTAGQGKFMPQRRRNPAVRLDVDGDRSPDVLVVLFRELKLGPQDVHALTGRMDLTSLMAFQAATTDWLSATA